MREQREPWLTLPAKEAARDHRPRVDSRFRTHVVTIERAASAPAPSPVQSVRRPMPGPQEPEIGLPSRTADAAPTAAAIERAAAAAAIVRPTAVRPEPPRVRPAVVAEVPRSPPKTAKLRAPTAPAIGLEDVPSVGSGDWISKVGEAAKMVDVVVVFYTTAYLATEMFEFAFRTVVNDVLPNLGRPYTVYRFSLDDEPEFVAEMATTLGLPSDNPVTVAGFAWSGPGRRLALLGDKALQSPAVFQRALRRSLAGEPAEVPPASHTRRPPGAAAERSGRGAARPWGARAVAIVAWCLFGTAALGAALVGVAPKWTNSLLQSTSVPPGADNPTTPANSQTGVTLPPAGPNDTNSLRGEGPPEAQDKPGKPAKHSQRKHASRLSLNPMYWGLPPLPAEGRSR